LKRCRVSFWFDEGERCWDFRKSGDYLGVSFERLWIAVLWWFLPSWRMGKLRVNILLGLIDYRRK